MKKWIIPCLLSVVAVLSCQPKKISIKDVQVERKMMEIVSYGYGIGGDKTKAEISAKMNAKGLIAQQLVGVDFSYKTRNQVTTIAAVSKNAPTGALFPQKREVTELADGKWEAFVKFGGPTYVDIPVNVPSVTVTQTGTGTEIDKIHIELMEKAIKSVGERKYKKGEDFLVQGKLFIDKIEVERENGEFHISETFKIILE